MSFISGAAYGAGIGFCCGLTAWNKNPRPMKWAILLATSGAVLGVATVAMGILFGSTGTYLTLGLVGLMVYARMRKKNPSTKFQEAVTNYNSVIKTQSKAIDRAFIQIASSFDSKKSSP